MYTPTQSEYCNSYYQTFLLVPFIDCPLSLLIGALPLVSVEDTEGLHQEIAGIPFDLANKNRHG